MKKVLFTILISIIVSNSFAQFDSTKVAFVSYWSIGDSYDFKVSKKKQQWKEGELTKEDKHEYIANFTVIDSTENSYTIKWSYENDLLNTYKIPVELLDKFSKYNLSEVEYKTSEVGDLVEIVNWEEIGEVMNNLFDDIILVLGEEDDTMEETVRNVMKPFKEIYSSKEGVERLVLKELQSFHFPMGIEFDVTEPLYYEEELPNMFGGKPIKAKTKLYFENIDFEESFCVVKQEMSLDKDDTRKVLEQVFKEMKLDDKELKEALKTAVFEVNDKNTYEYYFNPGIPHKVEIIREVNVDINNEKGKRLDITLIELIYNF